MLKALIISQLWPPSSQIYFCPLRKFCSLFMWRVTKQRIMSHIGGKSWPLFHTLLYHICRKNKPCLFLYVLWWMHCTVLWSIDTKTTQWLSLECVIGVCMHQIQTSSLLFLSSHKLWRRSLLHPDLLSRKTFTYTLAWKSELVNFLLNPELSSLTGLEWSYIVKTIY